MCRCAYALICLCVWQTITTCSLSNKKWRQLINRRSTFQRNTTSTCYVHMYVHIYVGMYTHTLTHARTAVCSNDAVQVDYKIKWLNKVIELSYLFVVVFSQLFALSLNAVLQFSFIASLCCGCLFALRTLRSTVFCEWPAGGRRQAFYIEERQIRLPAHDEVVGRLFSQLLKATIELACTCMHVGVHVYRKVHIAM